MSAIQERLTNKRVLITGACGTVGSELVRQLLKEYHVGELVALDNNEDEVFQARQRWSLYTNATFTLADIRDRDRLPGLMRGVDVVFHAAAYKHVLLCELAPFEAIQTNLIGLRHVIAAAVDCGVGRVISMSTDKAVDPSNAMGATKLLSERMVTATHAELRGKGPLLASTRFGNVLGSRGSVMRVFEEQIRRGKPVTLTDRRMLRFVMTVAEAARLVIDSAGYVLGGEVFIAKMPAIRIIDLAEVMVEQLAPVYGRHPTDIPIKAIGARSGERLGEAIMTVEEAERAWELDQYYVVLPDLPGLNDKAYQYPGLRSERVDGAYTTASTTAMSKPQLLAFLRENGLMSSSPTTEEPATKPLG